MICACCDMPLRDGDDYTRDVIDGATGGGGVIYRHRQPCKRTNTPTSQTPATGSRRRR